MPIDSTDDKLGSQSCVFFNLFIVSRTPRTAENMRVHTFLNFATKGIERLYSSSTRETGCNTIRCQISTTQQKKLTMKLDCPSTPYLATIYFGHSLVTCKARLGMHCLVRNVREIKVTSWSVPSGDQNNIILTVFHMKPPSVCLPLFLWI